MRELWRWYYCGRHNISYLSQIRFTPVYYSRLDRRCYESVATKANICPSISQSKPSQMTGGRFLTTHTIPPSAIATGTHWHTKLNPWGSYSLILRCTEVQLCGVEKCEGLLHRLHLQNLNHKFRLLDDEVMNTSKLTVMYNRNNIYYIASTSLNGSNRDHSTYIHFIASSTIKYNGITHLRIM